jgi:organic hydroperoxide reductase OsmC/OhrA
MLQPDKILYEAEVIATGGHERCPHSNATRGNIDVKLTVL